MRSQLPRKKRVEEIDPLLLKEPSLTVDQHRVFEYGISLFHEARFWEAHEAWEEVWKGVTEESRIFFQGIIQAAAGFHLVFERPRPSGAEKNFVKALRKLDLFPDTFLGINVEKLRRSIRQALKAMERGEKITVAAIPKLSKSA